MKVGIIGRGAVGRELNKQSDERGDRVWFTAGSKGMYNSISRDEDVLSGLGSFEGFLNGIERLYVAMTTLKDGGAASLRYMLPALQRGIPVEVCEKAGLGNHYKTLEGYMHLIGCSTTVGGASGIFPFARKVCTSSSVKTIYAIVNGTMNCSMDWISRGRNPDSVAEEIATCGYAEPFKEGENPDLRKIINNELCLDLPLKTVIFGNVTGIVPYNVRGRDIKSEPLGESDFKKIVRESRDRRCVLSFGDELLNLDRTGGFSIKVGDVHIQAGFIDLRRLQPDRKLFTLEGVGNMVYISDETGKDYYLSGKGAGVKETASEMIKDAVKIRKRELVIA